MSRTRRTARLDNPTLAIGYIRASKDEAKLGPEAQREQIEAFARVEGLTIVAWHQDQGVSGGAEVEDRPALLAALAELDTAKAGVLLVAKRDRLARNSEIAGFITYSVRKAGARVLSADGANGEDMNDRMMRTLQDMFAEQERFEIRRRTKAALAAKKARGEHLGGVPYGFQRSGTGLVPNVAEQGVIAVVKALRAEGLSLRQIVAELDKRGLVSRVGRPFNPMQIGRMAA
jgi:DNA invertase Pin-like site-specific DNA recombinase